MNRETLFESARDKCIALKGVIPPDTLVRLLEQIDFLLDVERGSESHLEWLRNISIGLIAVRELEVIDDAVIEVLCAVQREADKMALEKKSSRAGPACLPCFCAPIKGKAG